MVGAEFVPVQVEQPAQLDYQLNTDGPEVLPNLNRLAGTAQESRPVNQTLEYFLGKIGPDPIAGLRQRMVQRLIRMKALDAARLQGRFVVLIDGSGYLVFHSRHCDDCLTQRHGETTLYMHQVLEAKVLGPAGTVISIASEFIDRCRYEKVRTADILNGIILIETMATPGRPPVAIRPNGAVRRGLETLFHLGTIGDLSDGQLLERFTTCTGDAAELAFAALVERHGPMVLRVCRSSLNDPNDAQDAFQATFLVLVQKARALWVQDSLGPWLHRVAYRIASRARRSAARRREHERRAAESRPSLISGEEEWKDVFAVLHEEIDRLPNRCRLPVVLCDLEGLTHEQVARHLGWPIGTVKSRLTRGREWLRARLGRRGVAPVAGLLAVTLTVRSASAAVPAELVEATARAARDLAAGAATAGVVPATVALLVEGALNAMLMTKLKFAVLACGILAIGAFVVAQPVGRTPQSRTQPVKVRAARIPEASSKEPNDATRGEVAVARELKRLELHLVAAELQMLQAEVTTALEERERRAEIARQVVDSNENEDSVRRKWAEQAEEAARHYEELKTRYLSKARELMTERQRIGLDPNWGREESPSETPPPEQLGEPTTGQSGPHPTGAAIGSVDMDAVWKRYARVQKLMDQLALDTGAAQRHLEKSRQLLKEGDSFLQKFVPGTPDYIIHEKQVSELRNRLETEQEKAEREFTRRQAGMTATLYQKIQQVIAKVAKARGLDYVVKVSVGPRADSDPQEVHDALGRSVIYANPRNDLTEEVIRELNRKFEADAAQPPR